MDLEYFVQVKRRKREDEWGASQKKSEESRPLGGKENYDRVGFADRLQNKTGCNFMQSIGSGLVSSMLTAGANKEIAVVRIFCENELRNSQDLFIPSAFSFSFFSILLSPPPSTLQKVSFN